MKDTTNIKNKNLTKIASKSAFWTVSGQSGVSAIRFVGTAILARILVPEDFGIIGMAMLFTGVIQLFGHIGMGAALIQRKDIDQEYLSTAYWTGIFIALTLTTMGIIFAPLAGKFFHQDILVPVIITLSLNFIIGAIASIQATLLNRDLKFKKLAIIEISTTILRVATVLTLAFCGFGYWSIILGIVFERILKTIAITVSVDWRPTFQFNWEKFKHLFRFGRNLYGQVFLGYISGNMDFLVTGRYLGADKLGYYQFAFNLPHLVYSLIVQSVDQATFPLYSKIQDDKPRVARGYLRTVQLVSMITFPLMFGLFFVAKDFITVAYGGRWLPAVIPLQILCLSTAFGSIFTITNSLLKALGRPDIGLKWNLIKFPFTIMAIIYFSRWGINGVATAMLILTTAQVIIVKIGLIQISTSVGRYLRSLKSATICALIMMGGLLVIDKTVLFVVPYPVVRLSINILVGLMIYVLSLKLICNSDYKEVIKLKDMLFSR